MKIVSDNPNPRAYIGILCPHIFFYFALKSVYKNLANAEFILDFTASPIGFTYPEWYKNRMRKALTKAGVFWRDYENSLLRPGEFFSKYTTLVAAFHSGLIAHPCNNKKKKARVFYSTAKESWVFALWNVYFDLILCPSDFYTHKINRLYGPIAKTVGEPKLDALLDSPIENFLTLNQIILDPLKPTLLYVPTWGALSSEEIIIPQLLQFLSQYNIIYKPHHMTFMSRYDFISNLSRASEIQIATEDVSLMELLKIEALIISDNSGAIFDALHLNKSFILIDTIKDSPEDIYTETPFFTFSGGKFTGVATTAQSLEQIIKEEGREIAPVVRIHKKNTWQNGSLKNALQQALNAASNEVFKKRQEALHNEYFEKNDGQSGLRAASAIRELADQADLVQNELRSYLEEFKIRVTNQTEAKMSLKSQSIDIGSSEILRIKKLPYFQKIKTVFDLFF